MYRPSADGILQRDNERDLAFVAYLRQTVATVVDSVERYLKESKSDDDGGEDGTASDGGATAAAGTAATPPLPREYLPDYPKTGMNRNIPPYNPHLTAVCGCNTCVVPLFNDESAKLCAYYIMKYVCKVRAAYNYARLPYYMHMIVCFPNTHRNHLHVLLCSY